MIGISLELCINDIVAGKVDLFQVERIVTSTECRDSKAWELVVDTYRALYWKEDPERCEQVFRQLLAEDKILQPRLMGGTGPWNNGVAGHWVNTYSEIEYTGEVLRQHEVARWNRFVWGGSHS